MRLNLRHGLITGVEQCHLMDIRVNKTIYKLLSVTLSLARTCTVFLCSILTIPGRCNHASPSTSSGIGSSPGKRKVFLTIPL